MKWYTHKKKTYIISSKPREIAPKSHSRPKANVAFCGGVPFHTLKQYETSPSSSSTFDQMYVCQCVCVFVSQKRPQINSKTIKSNQTNKDGKLCGRGWGGGGSLVENFFSKSRGTSAGCEGRGREGRDKIKGNLYQFLQSRGAFSVMFMFLQHFCRRQQDLAPVDLEKWEEGGGRDLRHPTDGFSLF